MSRYKEGDEILCINNHLVGVLKRDMSQGDIFGVDSIDFKQKDYKTGDAVGRCESCDGIWILTPGVGIDFINVRRKENETP